LTADMPKGIVVRELGGADRLRTEDIPEPAPGPGEARVRHTAIGLNFVDVYIRTGLYKNPGLPFVPGQEGAGIVEAVGANVTEVKIGDRVAYAGVLGAYAEVRVLPAARLVRLPDAIDDRTAAAVVFKGMTAEYLLRRCAKVQPGDTILVHAAAGGVGSLACQWARALGARVIGTAGGPDKVARALANGCVAVIDYQREEFLARVRELTDGKGVAVVLDSVGRTTFSASLDCLRPRGLLALFGQSSGMVPHFDLALLGAKGSLYVTRPSLWHYIATRDELVDSAAALFAVVANGTVRVEIGQTFALSDAAAAHEALEQRKTVGSTLLLP
jgi:NADPH:quinone reductase